MKFPIGTRLKFIGKQRVNGLPLIPRDAVVTVTASNLFGFNFKFDGLTWYGANKDFIPIDPSANNDTISYLDSICEAD